MPKIFFCNDTNSTGFLNLRVLIFYVDVSKSFRTGCLERELQMAQFSTTK